MRSTAGSIGVLIVGSIGCSIAAAISGIIGLIGGWIGGLIGWIGGLIGDVL